MSVPVTIIGVDVATAAVEAAATLGETLAADWEARFSRFRPNSLLCQLNATGGNPIPVDRPFLDLLDLATAAVARTGGRFDPAILPALEAAGYRASWSDRGDAPVSDGTSTSAGPASHPAAWQSIRIDQEGEVLVLPGQRSRHAPAPSVRSHRPAA